MDFVAPGYCPEVTLLVDCLQSLCLGLALYLTTNKGEGSPIVDPNPLCWALVRLSIDLVAITFKFKDDTAQTTQGVHIWSQLKTV